jgi:hypothetical protein
MGTNILLVASLIAGIVIAGGCSSSKSARSAASGTFEIETVRIQSGSKLACEYRISAAEPVWIYCWGPGKTSFGSFLNAGSQNRLSATVRLEAELLEQSGKNILVYRSEISLDTGGGAKGSLRREIPKGQTLGEAVSFVKHDGKYKIGGCLNIANIDKEKIAVSVTRSDADGKRQPLAQPPSEKGS